VVGEKVLGLKQGKGRSVGGGGGVLGGSAGGGGGVGGGAYLIFD